MSDIVDFNKVPTVSKYAGSLRNLHDEIDMHNLGRVKETRLAEEANDSDKKAVHKNKAVEHSIKVTELKLELYKLLVNELMHHITPTSELGKLIREYVN